ncbi:MAG: TonB-dependent receptor, partial [Clostridia bacterium]|nr:TonB-dependent receptor [Clostridia bacterium]
SMLISAYYRPTTDVMQRINWISSADGMMYQTHKNVAKSQSSGLEATIKNKFFSIVDLSTNINAYYYHLNGFDYFIDGQTVSGTPRHSFTWNARMQASVILPYDFSVQLSGRYRSRQAITQGYRKAGYNFDLGMRKNFFDKKLVLSVNCRDVLNSRRFRNYTSSDTFERHQLFRRGGRNVIFTLTWNFGSNNKPKEEGPDGQDMQQDDGMQQGGFEMGGE